MSGRARLAIVVAYVAFRLVVLVTSFDAVCLPQYELYPMGLLASVAGAGRLGGSLADFYDNCGGHLVTGLLAAPLYALLGDHYLVLKLVPIGLGVVALLLVMALVERLGAPRAAPLAGLLFAFGPGTLTAYSMLAKGNHFESVPFQLAVWWLFVWAHEEPGRVRRRIAVAAAAAGFATFVYFGSALLVAILCGTHVWWRGARRAAGDLRTALPAAALGLLPVAWIDVATGGRVREFLAANALRDGAAAPPAFGGTLVAFVTDVLPSAPQHAGVGPIPGHAVDLVWTLVFALAWLVLAAGLLRRGRQDAGRTPLVAYLPLFALAASVSGFAFAPYGEPMAVGRYRYLVPHFALASITIAIATHELARAGHRLGARALVALALLCGATNLARIDPSSGDAGTGWRYPGHDATTWAMLALRDAPRDDLDHLRTDPAAVCARLAPLAPGEAAHAWVGVGQRTTLAACTASEATGEPLALGALLDLWDPAHRPDVARGVGSALRQRLGDDADARARLRPLLAAWAGDGHPALPWVVAGLCIDPVFPLQRRRAAALARSERLAVAVPAALAWAWSHGRGAQQGRLLARGLPGDVEAVRALGPRVVAVLRRDHLVGLGCGLVEGGGTAELARGVLPEEALADVLVGCGYAARRRAEDPAILPDWARALPDDLRAAFATGWSLGESPDLPRPHR